MTEQRRLLNVRCDYWAASVHNRSNEINAIIDRMSRLEEDERREVSWAAHKLREAYNILREVEKNLDTISAQIPV